MRALRNRFPNALFFTTDLDARLVHPSEWLATHNLIIVSHYGRSTELSAGRVPPFRDSYQTSVFCAVLAALGDVTTEELKAAEPRRYEVGRRGEVDLSVSPAGRVHPPRRYGRSSWTRDHWRAIGIVVSVGIILFVWLRERRPREKKEPKVKKLKLFYLHGPFGVLTLGAVTLGLVWLMQVIGPADEPLLLFQGVSLWPTVALRLAALLLCLHCFYRAWKDLRQVEEDITDEFDLRPAGVVAAGAAAAPAVPVPSAPVPRPKWPGPVRSVLEWRDARRDFWLFRNEPSPGAPSPRGEAATYRAADAGRQGLIAHRRRLEEGAADRRERARGRQLFLRLERARRAVHATWTCRSLRDAWANRRWSLNVWPTERNSFIPPHTALDVKWLWAEYRRRGKRRYRLARAVPGAVGFFGIGLGLMVLFGFPHVPYRGEWTWWVDALVMYPTYMLLVLLTFLVIDATRLCERFTLLLCRQTKWPPPKIKRLRGLAAAAPDPKPEENRGLDEYLDIQLLARLTGVVGRLVYYPFLIITLLIVARNTYFDNWDWPPALLITMGGLLIVAVVAGLSMREAAENARAENLKSLRKMQLQEAVNGGGGDGGKLAKLIEEVETERRGTFASFGSHPLLRAFLLPSGGVGVWALLEWYANSR